LDRRQHHSTAINSLAQEAAMLTLALSTVDNHWPLEEPGFEPDDVDYDTPLEFDDEYWEALVPDDDYEPQPDYGDFWPEEDPI
jgi:hypothetical protein